MGRQVPTGSDWLHEIKYDGYRLIVHRDGDRVRLITRGGYDWSIVEAARRLRQKQFVIDGEAVILESTALRCRMILEQLWSAALLLIIIGNVLPRSTLPTPAWESPAYRHV